MQSCHLISAYCDYLFKTPSDTLAALFFFLKGEGQTKKVEEYLRDCLRNSSKLPTAADSLEGGDITIPSNSEHLLHLQKYLAVFILSVRVRVF